MGFMKLKVNGVEIYYEIYGKGQPLLMIHGNGEDHSIFYEAVSLLKEHFQCIIVDSRGHGESSPVKEYHYQDMADDMIALLQELNMKKTAVYGFSDGGIIGLLMASQCERISDLVISGANIHPFGVKLPVLLAIKKEYKKKHDPKLKLMIEEPDITKEELEMITARTLVLAGEHDLIRLGHTKKIASMIAGSRMRIIRGEDHGSYITHSEKIAVILQKWFGKGKA